MTRRPMPQATAIPFHEWLKRQLRRPNEDPVCLLASLVHAMDIQINVVHVNGHQFVWPPGGPDECGHQSDYLESIAKGAIHINALMKDGVDTGLEASPTGPFSEDGSVSLPQLTRVFSRAWTEYRQDPHAVEYPP